MKLKILGLLLSFFFFGITVSAVDLPEFESSFRFDGAALSVQQVQHHFTLVASTEEAKQALVGFRESGYTCEYVMNNMHRCKKFIPEKSENSEVRNQIIEENSAVVLSFEKTNNEYALVNEAPALQEYEKIQKSSFGKVTFDRIHFYVISGLKKFKVYNFGNSDSADHFYMTPGNLVAKQIRASKSFKRSISYIIVEKNVYLYEGVWKQ